VRQLDREIAALARKAARQLTRPAAPPALVLRTNDLATYLGPPRFLPDLAETIAECGIATGLAWTPTGGEILFVEATRMPGTGKLILTGSLGEVMKESAQAALSYLRSQGPALGLEPIALDNQDLHIHVPAGGTPKDGPSAGLTLVVALASLFSRRRVRSDFAMTGEISLRGRILPVGGVKEKALAAARSGIKRLLLPAGNRKDWADVPAEVRARLEVHFVGTIGEAVALALQERKSAGGNGDSAAPAATVSRRTRPA
jgi:ATP-dependent Lon protease